MKYITIDLEKHDLWSKWQNDQNDDNEKTNLKVLDFILDKDSAIKRAKPPDQRLSPVSKSKQEYKYIKSFQKSQLKKECM